MGRCLPRSGEGHIETPGVIQEPNALVLVGTHTGQNDEVLLPALEGIHTGNLHFLKETMPCQPQSCLVARLLHVPRDGEVEDCMVQSLVQPNVRSPELHICHTFRTLC